ncbi:unnamed protein product, partial [Linum tenue]
TSSSSLLSLPLKSYLLFDFFFLSPSLNLSIQTSDLVVLDDGQSTGHGIIETRQNEAARCRWETRGCWGRRGGRPGFGWRRAKVTVVGRVGIRMAEGWDFFFFRNRGL